MNLFLFKSFAEKNTRSFSFFFIAQLLTVFSASFMNHLNFYPGTHVCLDTINSIIELDSGEIVCGLANGSLEFFNNPHGNTNFLHGHTDEVRALVQINEKYLASASLDGTIKIWDLETYTCVKIFAEHKAGITSLKKLRNGAMLVSTSYDNSIRLWDTESGGCINELTEHNQVVCDVIELSNGDLASISEDRSIKIWNRETGKCLATYQTNLPLNKIIEPEAGILVAQSPCSNILMIWDFVHQIKAVLTCSAIVNTTYARKNGTIIAALNNGTIELWDPKNLTQFGVFDKLDILREKTLDLQSTDYSIPVWSLKVGKYIEKKINIIHDKHDLLKLDKKIFALRSSDYTVDILDFKTGSRLKSYIHKSCHLRKIFLRKNGDLVTVEAPNLVCVWPKDTRKLGYEEKSL